MARRACAANSGVPAKTIFIGPRSALSYQLFGALLHFEGNSVSLENHKELSGYELRFYENPLKIDITCYPVPFPRCGTFRSTENVSSGEYLMDQLQLLKARCQAQLVQEEKILESYEIHLP
jgi:hypothetical protein